jgi:hypothetical protein
MGSTLSLSSTERSIVMPLGRTKTPSSEFRVVEDNESDDRALWTEVEIEREPLRLYPGAVVVRR